MRYTINLYRKFSKYVKPYLKYYILLIPLSLLTSVITLPIPLMISKIVDITLEKVDNQTIIIALFIIGIYFVQAISQYFINIFYSKWGNQCKHEIREDILIHIQNLPIEYIDKVGTGDLISRIMDDISILTNILTSSLIIDLFSNMVIMFITIGILFWINWKLALTIFILLPIYCIIAKLFNKQIRKVSRQVQDKSAKLISLLNEIFQNQKIIRSFNSENYFTDKYNIQQKKLIDLYNKSNAMNFAVQQVTTFLINICPMLVLWVGIIMVKNGAMTIGLLIAFYQYVMHAFSPFQLFMRYNLQIQSSHGAIARIEEFLELHTENEENHNESFDMVGDININDMSFAYENSEYVLKEVSLSIRAGDLVGIIGTSGSGKSTFANLLMRFYETEKNKILFNGRDINLISRSQIREGIGLVTQDSYLFNDTIKANIGLAKKDASFEEIIAAAKLAQIHDYISELPMGYETIIEEKGTNLSGGQKQRISLARIFLKMPKIIIFDEATSALDANLETSILETIKTISKTATCIIISHKINSVKDADKILVLEKGSLIEQGTHEELMINEKLYYELFMKQNQGI